MIKNNKNKLQFMCHLGLTLALFGSVELAQIHAQDYTEEEKELIRQDPGKWKKENVRTSEDMEKFRAFRIKDLNRQKEALEKGSMHQSPVPSSALQCMPEQVKEERDGMQEMILRKHRLNEKYFPQFHADLQSEDFDLMVIIIGAGFNESHQRPQFVNEALKLGRKVKVINLDPSLESSVSFQDKDLTMRFYPVLFPGHDGSGFFPAPTKFDQDTLKYLDQAINWAKQKEKHIILISSASGYPQDTILALWKKWKDSKALHLVQNYASIPSIVFSAEAKDFPLREEMIQFGSKSSSFLPLKLNKILGKSNHKSWGKFFSHGDQITLKDLDI